VLDEMNYNLLIINNDAKKRHRRVRKAHEFDRLEVQWRAQASLARWRQNFFKIMVKIVKSEHIIG
jgi:hypothetical protein